MSFPLLKMNAFSMYLIGLKRMPDNILQYIAPTHKPVARTDSEDHNPEYGSGNGGGDDMLDRIKVLEEKTSALAVDVAVLKETVATKESLHKELNSQTWKIVLALVITVLIAVLSKYFIR